MTFPLAYFISGHGFGHSTRAMALCERLPRRVELTLYTSAPEWLFRQNLSRSFRYVGVELDVGAVQRDCFHPDPVETLRQFSQLWESRHARVAELADGLREQGARAAIVDIPPLGLEAAFAAGIPSVATTNFTWDWIYQPYVRQYPEYAHLLEAIRGAHSRAEAVFRLPYFGAMEGFRRVIPIGHLVRPPRLGRDETRRRMAFDPAQRHVLISFGGLGEKRLPLEAIARMSGFCFHLLQELDESPPSNLRLYRNGEVYHPDLVHACDVVLGKLGYGLVSECLAARRPLVYVPRTGFAEHDVFLDELPARLATVALPEADFLSGRWQESLCAALDEPARELCDDLDGASAILALLPRLFPGWPAEAGA